MFVDDDDVIVAMLSWRCYRGDVIVAHLRYEDCGHCLIERRAVHVDCGADGQHEPTDTGVHAWAVLYLPYSAVHSTTVHYSAVQFSSTV